jgi:peptide/nickel transport system ATP-binding protein
MYLGKIVETAPAAEIFENPLHPYTQALLSSVPTLSRRRFKQRIVLEGDVPSAIDPPEACRFASRCFRVIDRCRAEVPPLEGSAGDSRHLLACFNYAPLAAAGDEGRGARGDDG